MTVILNLTQHPASEEQKEAGVIDLVRHKRYILEKMIFSGSLPTSDDIIDVAEQVAEEIYKFVHEEFEEIPWIMIGGAPYLIPALETSLLIRDLKPVYAYSERVSQEQTLPDGTVQKISLFKHLGFIEATG